MGFREDTKAAGAIMNLAYNVEGRRPTDADWAAREAATGRTLEYTTQTGNVYSAHFWPLGEYGGGDVMLRTFAGSAEREVFPTVMPRAVALRMWKALVAAGFTRKGA